MRLSWYADTGVAVFSIWQGGTCTGTFRVPIADLPRLVDALQRGPAGATAPGADVPGTGARQIQQSGTPTAEGSGEPSPRAGGYVPGPPGDPLAAGAHPAGYPGADPYADAGRRGSLRGYGAPDRRPEHSDPAGYGGGNPDPLARSGYAGPGAYGGYPDTPESAGQAARRSHTEPGGHSGYPDPAMPLGQAGYAAYGGYPDPGGQAEPGSGQGYADPGPQRGYPDPADRGRQSQLESETAAYGGYPGSGEHRTAALSTGPGSHSGYPDGGYPDAGVFGGYPGVSGGYPDPDDYGRPPDQAERGNYPVAGDYGQPTGAASPVARGYPETGQGYPETGQYGRPAEAAGSPARGSYPAQDSYGGYPDPGSQVDSGPTRRGSGEPPYPPDPYLDGKLPVGGERSAADWPADDGSSAQRPVVQRSAASGPRRSEDESARELPYGYPPAVGR